ncbi:MAG: DPP IV N-terminal domain-containing protein [Nannocystaceae bacterium]
MKLTLIGTSVLATTLIAAAVWAGSPSAVANAGHNAQPAEVEGKFRLLRVAIPSSGRVGDLLRKNAKISSGFEVIDRRSMGALARQTRFDPKGWSALGADLVVLADASGAQIKVRMYELSKGARPVLSRGYPKDELKAANKFMNEMINYYTGQPGVFGSRVAFVRTQRKPMISKNVQSVEMNGEAPAAITNNRSLNILPSIGPGGQVLFTSYAKRNPDLWVTSGGGPKRISKYPGLNLGGVMSPDGGTVAVALSKDGNSEIYILDLSGGVKARLTNNAAIDGSPTFSSGGQIAFVSSRAGGPQIFRMSAAGGRATRVTRKGRYNQSPDWSQGKGQGQWIAYSGRDSSNRYDIFKVNIQTGQVARLTQTPGRNLDPSWSPDGRLISYYRDGGVYIANKDGNNQVQIVKGATTPDWGPRAY